MSKSEIKNLTLIPGFCLNNNMYNNLPISKHANNLEINCDLSWANAIDDLSSQLHEPQIIVGYSQGARLALAMAIERPTNISALVIISGNAGIENEQEREQRKQQDLANAELARTDLNAFWEKFDKNEVFDSEIENTYRINDSEIAAKQLTNLGQGAMDNYNDRISEIKVPIMFASGIRDKKYSAIARTLKKKTAFSHHILFDSDHRVVQNTPKNLNLAIEWFANNLIK